MKIHLFLTWRISGHFGHFPDSRNFGHFPIRTRAYKSGVRGLYVCPNQSLSPGLLVSKSLEKTDKTDFNKKTLQFGGKNTQNTSAGLLSTGWKACKNLMDMPDHNGNALEARRKIKKSFETPSSKLTEPWKTPPSFLINTIQNAGSSCQLCYFT